MSQGVLWMTIIIVGLLTFGIRRLMAISGAYCLLVFFEERKQTISSQSGHQLYLTLTVYTVPGAASPQSQRRNGSHSYPGSVPRCSRAACSSTQWAERTRPSGSCGLIWPATSQAK